VKVGVFINPAADTPVDAIVAQAQSADRQGFDSVWLGDHLIDYRLAPAVADGPPDSFTVMAAIGAVTTRIRLAWGMLNPSFRNPAHLAKMLATLDQLTKGRVICSLGAGWLKPEYDAYSVPFIDAHDERVAHGREVAQLLKELWTRPAPDKVTFEGTYVRTSELQFNPAPYRKPHPPIWIGGDSDETLATVKELADGWVPLFRREPTSIREVRSAPDWPDRPMSIVRVTRMLVGESWEDIEQDARQAYEIVQNTATIDAPETFEDFVAREVIGSPMQCRQRVEELGQAGIDNLLVTFESAEEQDRAARLLLPLL